MTDLDKTKEKHFQEQISMIKLADIDTVKTQKANMER